MNQQELIVLGFTAYFSLCIPLAASGFLRYRQNEMGPARLMGIISGGAGALGILCGIVLLLGLLPSAMLLMAFAISFGLGAWSFGAFLDKTGKRLPDYVMLFWVAIAVTLILTRTI